MTTTIQQDQSIPTAALAATPESWTVRHGRVLTIVTGWVGAVTVVACLTISLVAWAMGALQ